MITSELPPLALSPWPTCRPLPASSIPSPTRIAANESDRSRHRDSTCGNTTPPWGARDPLAHLGLARAARQAGDTSAARKAYEGFFALWKDADPDLSILIAAKHEYVARN